MEVKKDILWRVYLSYILIVVICLFIFGKAVYIQQVQGHYWQKMSNKLRLGLDTIWPQRGTIYSEDGKMLSTCIPRYDVSVDFATTKRWRENRDPKFVLQVDSLYTCLAQLFKNDLSAKEYKNIFQKANSRDRGFLLKTDITFTDYQQLLKFPIIRLGKFKSGFMFKEKSIRYTPFNLYGLRTIGFIRFDSSKSGLEATYDSLLKGVPGVVHTRIVTGGVKTNEGDYIVEPENGKDIVTTLDVFIQEVSENALMKMMIKNQADHGCAIVMETKTGKIKAIANLGRDTFNKKNDPPNYIEAFNYALVPSEPGSTFKLATMMSLLEDKKINLQSVVNLNGGTWAINGQEVLDAEQHGRKEVTSKEAFELSSNVGMAKMAWLAYSSNPKQFIDNLHKMHLDTLTGIDIKGEKNSYFHKPGSRYWNANTLPWMAFGYNIEVTPLQTITLYNSIANGGKMMRPYLLNAIKDDGDIIEQREPKVITEHICSDETLKELQGCLEGVCLNGTAKNLFKSSVYKVAGKTGTAKVANNNKGYDDLVYQSSFVGYFPADEPQYTCIVVIKNMPHAPIFYGADVAGPVFKEIADRLYTKYVHQNNYTTSRIKADTSIFNYVGLNQDINKVIQTVQLPTKENNYSLDAYINLNGNNKLTTSLERNISNNTMPSLKGMGFKDAVVLCEELGLTIKAKGKGRVIEQSILPGQSFAHGQLITVEFN